MARLIEWMAKRKYELLLFGLVQHLFAAMLVPSIETYTDVVWPINMVVLGLSCIGIFSGATGARLILRWLLTIAVLAFPAAPYFLSATDAVLEALSLVYALFFLWTLFEVMRYLLRPSYVNIDLVSASLCGYLLLIEVGAFALQAIYYAVPDAYHGIATDQPAHTWLDIEYFTSISVTSIGFGDITPVHHIARLATAALGILGQLYSVVLMGILISKYTASTQR